MSEKPKHISHELDKENPERIFDVDRLAPMYPVKIHRPGAEHDGSIPIDGDIVLALQPDKKTDHSRGDTTILLIRYPDGSFATAGIRTNEKKQFVVEVGRHLLPDTKMHYGRLGDGDTETTCEIIGAEALMGVQGRLFGAGVSRIHGSIEITVNGQLILRDGGTHDSDGEHHATTNGTRVITAELLEKAAPHSELIKEAAVIGKEIMSADAVAATSAAGVDAGREVGQVQDAGTNKLAPVDEDDPRWWLKEMSSKPETTPATDDIETPQQRAERSLGAPDKQQAAAVQQESVPDDAASALRSAAERLGAPNRQQDTSVRPESAADSQESPHERVARLLGGLNAEVPSTEIPEKMRVAHEKACAELECIIGTNGKGGGLLGDTLREIAKTPQELRDKLDRVNGDPVAREKVLSLLRVRAHNLYQGNAFLSGVQEDRMKPVEAGLGYDVAQMESLDKVAAIAMARLDGSFRDGDKIIVDRDELVNNGHHRDAANKVLESFAKEQIEDAPEFVDFGETINQLKREINVAYGEMERYRSMYQQAREELVFYTRRDRIYTDELESCVHTMRMQLQQMQRVQYDLGVKVRRTKREIDEQSYHANRSQQPDGDEIAAQYRGYSNEVERMDYQISQIGRVLQGAAERPVRYSNLINQMAYDRHPVALLQELQSWLRNHEESEERDLVSIIQNLKTI